MSRPRSKKKALPRSRKPQPDPYTSRIKREPSKRELEDTLRHAVRNQDIDALVDYDEKDLRPAAVDVNADPREPQDLPIEEWWEDDHDIEDDAFDTDWYNEND